MIVVTAILKAAEGKGDELEQEFRKFVPAVHKEPGNLAYVAHRGINAPVTFFVYEKYESQEALKEHSSAPHFKEFSKATASMLEGRAEIALYREIT